MSPEQLALQVDNLIEDYFQNNNEKPKFLLINSYSFQYFPNEESKFFKGLEIISCDDLFPDEIVVY